MSNLFWNTYDRNQKALYFSENREIEILEENSNMTQKRLWLHCTTIAAGSSGTKAAEPLRPTCFIYYIVSSRERRKKNRYTDFTLGNTAAVARRRAAPPPPYRRFYGMCVAIIIIRFYDLVKWPFWGGFVYLLICTRDQRARTRRRGLSDSDLICSVQIRW